MISILRRGLLVLLAAFPLMALAAQSPHDVVQSTTTELLGELKANKEQYKSNPQAFYDTLDRILAPVVDADGISRSIMTVKYSRKATPEQMQRSRKTSSAACSSSTVTRCWSTTTRASSWTRPRPMTASALL
jgi:ABC-type transport system involved in resistance to organic solvents, auxiliary component